MNSTQIPIIEIGDTKKLDWSPSPWPGVFYKFLRLGAGGYDVVDLLKIEKGVTLLPHRHSGPQSSYLISGRAKTFSGQILDSGSWIHIPAGLRHGHVAEEEVVWIDFFPGLLTWFLDDGSVFNLKADGNFVSRGAIHALGASSLI
jgi:hypothetical protein